MFWSSEDSEAPLGPTKNGWYRDYLGPGITFSLKNYSRDVLFLRLLTSLVTLVRNQYHYSWFSFIWFSTTYK